MKVLRVVSARPSFIKIAHVVRGGLHRQWGLAAAARLGLRVWMLPDLVTNLVEAGVVASGVGKDVLVTIAPRYRAGVIVHSQVRLEEIENAHRRSAS